jgi:hypothetical protein
MEKHQNNPIQDWIDTDKKLSSILVEIQEMPISIEEQAEIAFHKVSEAYSLPKFPQDIEIEDEDIKEPISVYHHLGIIKFLNPESDPRGNVLSAIYFAKENLEIDYEIVFLEAIKCGIDVSQITGIGFLDENSYVKIVFVKNTESWYELGCNFFIKIVEPNIVLPFIKR